MTLQDCWREARSNTNVTLPFLTFPCLIRRPRSLCSLWKFAVKLTTKSHGAILRMIVAYM